MLTFDRSLQRAVLRRLSPIAVALTALVAASAQAATVLEVGDAGQTLATAQVTSGAGALTGIFGSIGATNDADVFLINITAPLSFSASTVAVDGLEIDTQLFLFTQSGAPVYANDDGALSVLSALPAGDALGPLTPGLYYLAIALSGYEPVNSSGQLLFSSGLPTDLRGPAFGLQPAKLSGFDGDGFGPAGAYNIQLSGAAVSAVPEPATALMFLVGGALAAAQWSRRRAPAKAAALAA